jgi:hypothetical protein
VFYGTGRMQARVEEVSKTYSEEEIYYLEVEGAHSFITEVCTVHNLRQCPHRIRSRTVGGATVGYLRHLARGTDACQAAADYCGLRLLRAGAPGGGGVRS